MVAHCTILGEVLINDFNRKIQKNRHSIYKDMIECIAYATNCMLSDKSNQD